VGAESSGSGGVPFRGTEYLVADMIESTIDGVIFVPTAVGAAAYNGAYYAYTGNMAYASSYGFSYSDLVHPSTVPGFDNISLKDVSRIADGTMTYLTLPLSISRPKFKWKPNPCGCFTEGTLVSVEDGYKKIEDLMIGDLVWAYNPETGLSYLEVITDTIRLSWDEVFVIHVGGEEIEATHEHPFFVQDKWIKASNLKIGDTLQTLEGGNRIVEYIEFKKKIGKVYNLTVDKLHTYYVSKAGIRHSSTMPIVQSQQLITWEVVTLQKKNMMRMATILLMRMEMS
jgi:hypothetical protein